MKVGWLLAPAVLAALLAARPTDDDPTYADTIQPILAKACVPCHHPGGESPFALNSFADAKRRASLMRWVCIVGTMPPVDAHSEMTEFAGVGRMTDADLVELQEWVRTGAAEGRTTRPTPPPKLPWRLDNPSTTLRAPTAGSVPAEGPPWRKLFLLDASPYAGRALTGFSLRGDAPLALRQAYLSVLPDGDDPSKAFTDLGIDVKRLVGAWAPGYPAWKGESGIPIPAKAKLAVWALYQPTGKSEPAGFELNLQFADQATPFEWKSMGNRDFSLPPSDGLDTLTDRWVVDKPCVVSAIVPECKLFALQVRVFAKLPDKPQKSLLIVKTWDRNWVGAYNLNPPVRLPIGTEVSVEIDYDNSGHSQGNREQKPTTSIKFGPTDKDEHFGVHFQTVPDVP